MSDPFRPRPRWRGCLVTAAALAAALVGAAAYAAGERMPGRSFEGPPPAASAAERALASALAADVRALASDIGERNERRYAALVRARDLVEARLREAGLDPRRDSYDVRGRTFDNVVADVGPSGATLVVGAHYDSALGSPGANDDASGVAVLLALAERFAREPPPFRVRLIAFTNEEPPHFAQPTMGSRVYARRAAARGELPDAMIALDSLGYYDASAGSQRYGVFWHSLIFGDRGTFVAFVSDSASEELLRNVLGAFRRSARVPSEGAVLSRRSLGAAWSDHASFWAHGVPAILVTDTAAFRDPHYHQHSDDGRQIDELALARVTLALEAAIRGLELRRAR